MIKKLLSNTGFLLSFEWEKRPKLFILYGLNIIFTLALSAAVIFTPRALINELTSSQSIESIISISLVFLAIASVSGFFLSYIKRFYISYLQQLRSMHQRITTKKILEMDYASYESPKNLDRTWMASSASSGYNFGIQSVYMKLFSISANIVTSCFCLWILAYLDIWVLIFLLINIGVFFYFSYKSNKFEADKQEELSPIQRLSYRMNQYITDFSYGKDIRIYGLSNWLFEKYRELFSQEDKINREIQHKHLSKNIVDTVFALLRDILIYGFLTAKILASEISIGDFSMCFAAVASLTVMFQAVFEDIAFVSAQQERISVYREFVDEPNAENREKTIPVPQSDSFEIEFCNVTFAYEGSDVNIYENLNLKISAKEKLAIVGLNGAGKTTLIKLLLRFYKLNSGEIRLNSVNIEEFDVVEYRRLFSAVFQEINIFAMTVGENVALSNQENIDKEKVMDSLEKAGFAQKCATFEKGLDTQLLRYLYEDGVELSGGEKQKIAIARAIYKSSPVLILDEPTAALDAVAEYDLYKNLAKLSEDKSVLFISHRLASTRFCDKIALMGNKGVAEYGTHEELMAQKGVYFNLFNTQMKYYKEEGSSCE